MEATPQVRRILFISYDGMTDPLGQSQVLPYLVNLSKRGYKFTLLSTEKPARYAQHKATIQAIVDKAGIQWETVQFTASPPVLAKYYDLHRLKQKAIELQQKNHFDLIHCRSYVSAAIGLMLKRRFGVKMLFDMRGFWVDERVEGNIWNIKNPIFKLAYKLYKQKEADYIAHTDGIISLTENGKREMEQWPAYRGAPIQVIPCSSDFDLFTLVTPAQRQQAKQQLQLQNSELVISYLGSIGAWYLLEEMLDQFVLIKKAYPTSKFFFITQEPAAEILTAARQRGLLETDFLIRPASRKQVPEMLAASDINLFFIKPSYSKKASSPTKLGEILAMGIPVICNANVGDVEAIIEQTGGGVVVQELTEPEYNRAVAAIPALLQKDPVEIRRRAQEYYDLATAVDRYEQQYKRLLNG